jgi:hypothetical protein
MKLYMCGDQRSVGVRPLACVSEPCCCLHLLAQLHCAGFELTGAELADWMLKLQDEGRCHNINFVTPEHCAPQVRMTALPPTAAGATSNLMLACQQLLLVAELVRCPPVFLVQTASSRVPACL